MKISDVFGWQLMQPESGLIVELERVPVAERQQWLYENFDNSLVYPIREDHNATFVYRGAAQHVELVGDMNNWRTGTALRRIEGTDLFAFLGQYEPDARLDYKFIVDGEYRTDPLNPAHASGGYGDNSELRMPRYPAHPETVPNPALPPGTLHHEGRYHVYLPPGWNPSTRYRAVYFQDGSEYLEHGRAATVLDYLIAHNQIEPVLAIFVDPTDRMHEYTTNEAYVRYFIDELMPAIESRYAVKDDRVLVGDSLGGLISCYLAWLHPQLFGYVLSHSGAFPPAYSGEFRSLPVVPYARELKTENYPIKLYLTCGTYDSYIDSHRLLYRDLQANPSLRAVTLRTYPQGHSWGLWRDTLGEGLSWLIGQE